MVLKAEMPPYSNTDSQSAERWWLSETDARPKKSARPACSPPYTARYSDSPPALAVRRPTNSAVCRGAMVHQAAKTAYISALKARYKWVDTLTFGGDSAAALFRQPNGIPTFEPAFPLDASRESHPLPGLARKTFMTRTRRKDMAVLPVCFLASTLAGCSSPNPNRDPTGEELPPLAGKTLEGEELHLPEDLRGEPAVLLAGFEQEAQFDADRWLFGLLQSETPARVLELPTIPGRIAGAFARFIDSGMRSGIPHEDWGAVLTLYGESARVMRTLTGNEGGRNMRVLLIDAHGEIRWFHDRGFSAGKLLELDREVRSLAAASTGGEPARARAMTGG